jgi:hypothetical protein
MARRRIAKKDNKPDATPSAEFSAPFPFALPDDGEELSEAGLFEMLSGMMGAVSDGSSGLPLTLPFCLPDNPPAPKQPPYTPPTRVEWEELYKAATAFRDLSPWEELEESDLFGVRDPETSETYYCCILGAGGELAGLNVYRGSRGLSGHWKIQGQYDPEMIEDDPAAAMQLQDCITASFVDREELTEEDLARIKELGLKFRGKGAWPQFLSYLPGFFPWRLSGPEARFLTIALTQAVEVVRAEGEKAEYLLPPAPGGHYLVRMHENGEWTDRYERAELYTPSLPTPAPMEEARVTQLRETLPKGIGALEIDHFYLPMPVFESEDSRPFMPLGVMIADHESGAILNMDFVEPVALSTRLPERLLDTFEKAGHLSRRVLVSREETFVCLEPTTERLGIELLLIGELAAVEQAQEGLLGFLMMNMGEME